MAAQTVAARLNQLIESDADTADLDKVADLTATAAEVNLLDGAGAVVASGTQQSSIADLSVTGTYATDDTPIETAVNEIIAVLLEFGMIEAAA